MERISECPLTPLHGITVRKYDIFGKMIPCKCGYHESAEKAGTEAASSGQLSAPQASAAAGRALDPQTSTGAAAGSAGRALDPQTSTGAAAGSAGRALDPQTSTGAAAGSAGRALDPQTSTGAAAEKATGSQGSAGAGQKTPVLFRISETKSVTCSLCSLEVISEEYTQHLSDYHVQEQCEKCGAKAWGTVGLLQHIESAHLMSYQTNVSDVPTPISPTAQETSPAPQRHSGPPVIPPPAPTIVQETSPAPQRHSGPPVIPPPAPTIVQETSPAPQRHSGPPVIPPPAPTIVQETSPVQQQLSLRPPEVNWITKKLAGGIENTATWMTNIGNEFGQVLNSVLTTGEGSGLDDLCQGIVQRYRDAGEPEPDAIYVDRDCCSETGVSPVLYWFRPWTSKVRLDVFHFMRRFTRGLITEHHPLYGTFCSKLSSCIFEWDRSDIQRLKQAKREQLIKKNPGHTPSDNQVLSSITSSELAKHCRRRTRGVEETRALIQQLLDSMWELTDTTGLPLINQESMSHVWEIQQKHLPCIQDPPGVQLYTNTGTGLEKGDKELDVLRCGRGSSSLESFHKHQCSFIPGWRCNALHTQMYMLEGVSRWNINRSQQALNMNRTSQTKIYDVRLMSNVNTLSNRVLGSALLPEFIPPGKPTGERIAVEYLLAQSNRGDLLSGQNEIIMPEMLEEVQQDEDPDATIPRATDITFQSSSQESTLVSDVSSSPVSSPFEESLPMTTPEKTPDSRCDPRGIPGWEAVDDLAGYLVNLNRTITALSNAEKTEILRLYSCLDATDKSPTKYSLKTKKTTLTGPWRASRKRSGSAPGQQAAERLFMVHGQAAHRPDFNRISECVALRLYKEFKEARNRPKDNKGKTFAIPQSIVMAYSHIKQLIEDCKEILDNSNLVLVTINNTTVSSWLQDRQKRMDRDSLLQGVQLPQQVDLATESLLEAQDLPSEPVQHGHKPMEFPEPENLEGEAMIRPRRGGRKQVLKSHSDTSYSQDWSSFQPPSAQESQGWSSFQPPSTQASQGWSSFQPPSAATSQGWSSFQPPSAATSQGWSSFQPPSAATSQGWSSFQPPSAATSQGWSSFQPPSAATSQGWSSFQPPSAATSQGWSSFQPPSAATSQGWSSFQPPSAATSQGWSSFQPPSAPASQGWLPSQLPPVPASHSQGDQPDQQPPNPIQPATAQTVHNRFREWRLRKAAVEDQEREMRGETPKKRQTKESYHYQCKVCGKAKSKITGHTQLRGKWYCPSSGQTITEWKNSL
ncbi:uncharacterized protein LOC121629265 [Melanotaenia boesemani]|uniref:uncharacterized protein LOC121629265 n=1 Tax=Melanotaenia boesemani TaxID=1250792 RepID=UPI001C053255|nr:uncharacterized protein LOC121629265 [Melanotaenia boesemani]